MGWEGWYPLGRREDTEWMVTVSKAERLLQTYDFDELLDINDLTEEDVVTYLLENDKINYIKPVDL